MASFGGSSCSSLKPATDVLTMASLKTLGLSSIIAFAYLLLAAWIDIIARADDLVDGARTAGSLHRPESEGAFRHLLALQDIAEANGGNRAAGTPGYDRSAEYVAGKLNEAGYVVRFEEFEFPFFEE